MPDVKTTYQAEVAIKSDWQTWKPLPSADPAFYDNSEPFNNLNKRASNYSDVNDYDLYLALEADVEQSSSGIITRYRKLLGKSNALDYGVNSVSPDQWSCVISTEDTNGNDLSGTLNYTGDVVMKAIWTLLYGDIADFQNAWGIHRLQGINGDFNSIYEFSSLRANVAHPPNPMHPLTGETMLKVEYVGNTIITKCLIDGTLLQNNQSYRLTGRLGIRQLYFTSPTVTIIDPTANLLTGEYSFGQEYTPGFNTFTDSDVIEIKVYDDGTGDLIETVTGAYGADFTSFNSDAPANTVLNFMTGIAEDFETGTFQKYDWAVATGFTDLDAKVLRWDWTIYKKETGQTSVITEVLFPIETLSGVDY